MVDQDCQRQSFLRLMLPFVSSQLCAPSCFPLWNFYFQQKLFNVAPVNIRHKTPSMQQNNIQISEFKMFVIHEVNWITFFTQLSGSDD